MELLNQICKLFIDNNYVFYKEHNTIIIIMEKLNNDFECISEYKPKKYFGESLKIILMFDIHNSYKLISNIKNTKYKLNTIIESDFYLNLIEAYNLRQEYYENDTKCEECNYNNGIHNGLCKYYYENGQIADEFNYINV